MWNGLVDGDPSGQILTTWIAKEELRGLFATARRGGNRHDIAHRLTRFYAWCAGPGSLIPELQRLASTIDAWWPQILAFLTTGVTRTLPAPLRGAASLPAGTEATNRIIKDTARTTFGFRNLDNRRRRGRYACTRRNRLATVTCS